MKTRPPAADFLPDRMQLTALKRAAAGCRGCELYKHATQTVFGAGPRQARLMLVGEMPGDEEDQKGKPFVGPAGRLLSAVLQEVGIERNDIYLTNAVKHFRWEPRGTRRLHKKPSARQVGACKPWLEAEMLVIKPRGIVCLGATAAQDLLGRQFRVSKERGKVIEHDGESFFVATHHPSAILRAPDTDARHRMRNELASDLRRAKERLD